MHTNTVQQAWLRKGRVGLGGLAHARPGSSAIGLAWHGCSQHHWNEVEKRTTPYPPLSPYQFWAHHPSLPAHHPIHALAFPTPGPLSTPCSSISHLIPQHAQFYGHNAQHLQPQTSVTPSLHYPISPHVCPCPFYSRSTPPSIWHTNYQLPLACPTPSLTMYTLVSYMITAAPPPCHTTGDDEYNHLVQNHHYRQLLVMYRSTLAGIIYVYDKPCCIIYVLNKPCVYHDKQYGAYIDRVCNTLCCCSCYCTPVQI